MQLPAITDTQLTAGESQVKKNVLNIKQKQMWPRGENYWPKEENMCRKPKVIWVTDLVQTVIILTVKEILKKKMLSPMYYFTRFR
jgi:hypothetical protein